MDWKRNDFTFHLFYIILEQMSEAVKIDKNRFYKLFFDPGNLTRFEQSQRSNKNSI